MAPVADLDRLVRSVWLGRWARRLGIDRQSDPFDAARTLANDLRALLVTQRQTRLDVRDSIEDDAFLDRRMTLLASGLANCELMAVCLADGLRSLGHAATVRSTGDQTEHGGAHTLVHLEAPTGTAFVDAWSDVRAMHVAGVGSGIGPDRAPPGVPEHETLDGLTIQANGIYPASAYRAGHAKAIPERRPSLLGLRRDWQRQGVGSPLWADYVDLRLRHLFGSLADPSSAYRRFAEREGLPETLRITLAQLARLP